MFGFLGGWFGSLWAPWGNLRYLWVLGMPQDSSAAGAVLATIDIWPFVEGTK